MLVTTGAVACAYAYRNFESLNLTHAKVLFDRVVNLNVISLNSVLQKSLSYLETIWNKLAHTVIAFSILEISLKDLMVGILLAYIMRKLVYAVGLIYKVGIYNDALPIYKFLWQCPSACNAGRMRRSRLVTIVQSEPHERYKIFEKSRSATFSEVNLEKRLELANYPDPSALAKIIEKYYPDPSALAKIIEKYSKFQDKILYYFSKYPELYHGQYKLSVENLDTIFSSENFEFLLGCLGKNPFLLKEHQKDLPLTLKSLSSQSSGQIVVFQDWISFFKDSSQEINKFLKVLKKDSKNEFSLFIRKKIIAICEQNSVQQENLRLVGLKLDFNKFFNDPNINHWNHLPGITKSMDDTIWDQRSEKLSEILQNFCNGEFKSYQSSIEKCFEKCLLTKDVLEDETNVKKKAEEIKIRIFAGLNYLETCLKLSLSGNLKKIEKESFELRIKSIIDILYKGGENCSDGSLAALTLAENLIKIFSYPNYEVNVFVNLFKHSLLREIDYSSENSETYLYYLLQFNDILQLGITFEKMINENKAKKIALVDLMRKLQASFTIESFVNFVAHSEEYRMLHPIDNITILHQIEELNKLMEDIYELEDKEKQKHILERIQRYGIDIKDFSIEKINQNPREFVGIFHHQKTILMNEYYLQRAQTLVCNSDFIINQRASI
ncbi:MAG: hypothetical protein C5B43_04030 [Verrucomicrobia bacterium]|nr:MAG: hypothetical protein C5B43_04030 [Verrucomicrobiota bacterium]